MIFGPKKNFFGGSQKSLSGGFWGPRPRFSASAGPKTVGSPSGVAKKSKFCDFWVQNGVKIRNFCISPNLNLFGPKMALKDLQFFRTFRVKKSIFSIFGPKKFFQPKNRPSGPENRNFSFGVKKVISRFQIKKRHFQAI